MEKDPYFNPDHSRWIKFDENKDNFVPVSALSKEDAERLRSYWSYLDPEYARKMVKKY